MWTSCHSAVRSLEKQSDLIKSKLTLRRTKLVEYMEKLEMRTETKWKVSKDLKLYGALYKKGKTTFKEMING
jgi:hypothetical protein